MHYRMNNSNDYGHLRVRSNIVRLRGSQILSRVYLLNMHQLNFNDAPKASMYLYTFLRCYLQANAI